MINAFTIDLEYWYSPELVKRFASPAGNDQLVEATMPLVNLLDKYNTRATFFILGKVAEKHPDIVKTIFNKGHEIASHGYSHRKLHELGKEGFEEEIKKTSELLQSITGRKPIGFRAPTFSLDNSTRWALDILVQNGYKYDSSICPTRMRLYGVSKAPLYPYRPSFSDIRYEDIDGINNGHGSIVEFPMTVIKLGKNTPVAGGFYLRALPFWFLKQAIKKVNESRPAVIYIHPWETYLETPRVKNLPLASKFITYYGISSALRKIESLLKEFQFKPMYELLNAITCKNERDN